MSDASGTAVSLTTDLIRCASVTPRDDGAIPLLAARLGAAGFACSRADRGGIANLVARYGSGGPVLGFNGHTDVVPVGEGWTLDPFAGVIRDGRLWGRGACDMKSGVAAFVSAAERFVAGSPDFPGSILITVTGDEEGIGQDGTAAILDWMAGHGIAMDHCLVGEPTCRETMGDMMKIGRRGSATGRITATGLQGHSAYPHRARNPLEPLVALLHDLATWRLDEGTAHFDPSTLAIVTVDTGNPASNVIPGQASATVNIRFNDAHSGASLREAINARMAAAFDGTGVAGTLDWHVSGESFITEPDPFSTMIADAAQAVTGQRPEASTTGGTSDARFIRALCPVVEFGLVGRTMHQADENVEIAHIEALEAVYLDVLRRYFGSGA